MICKGCGRQIPDGTELCLLCGTRQTQYVLDLVEVAQTKKTDKRFPRTAAAAVIAGIAGFAVFVSPLLAGGMENEKLLLVENAYNDKNIDTFVVLASQFYDRYPDSPEMETVYKYASGLGLRVDIPGITPRLAEVSPDPARQLPLPELSGDQVRGAIIEIDSLKWHCLKQNGSVKCELNWVNRSTKTVTRALFDLELYDREGKPLPCQARGEAAAMAQSVGVFLPGGKVNSDSWIDLWFNKDAARVKIIGVQLDYSDKTSVILGEDEINGAFVD
ncbi:hypothetical protein FACS1894171_1700 [Clostridia bacterium]|nr:hypothetical protein FACS1894171_1700 [Clostridia bacterium]